MVKKTELSVFSRKLFLVTLVTISALITGLSLFSYVALRYLGVDNCSILANLGLNACQQTIYLPAGRPPGPVKPDDPAYPVLNPNPQHRVRVYGTVPEGYRFQLLPYYQVDSTADECWRSGPRWQDTGEKYKTRWLDMKWEGRRYEATLVVDKYLPGRCKWRLAAVKAYVLDMARDNGDAQVVIEGRGIDEDDNAPQCPPPNSPFGGLCTEDRARRLTNSNDDISLLMKCRWFSSDEVMSGKELFICQHHEDDSYKKTHQLRRYTRAVKINVSIYKREDLSGGT